MHKLILVLVSLFITFNLYADKIDESKPKLLFYCGITMVKPMQEIAKIIEKKHNCTIKITQGGSKDLYDSLKLSKIGDLYLPGSESYRVNNLKDGILLDNKYIGYNKAAFFVKKNNPKKIKGFSDLERDDLKITLCNPKSGSIGRMTKNILIRYKDEEYFEAIYDNTTTIGTDSRNLNKAIIDGVADLSINWRATAFWPENSDYIDIIEINEEYAPKKKLIINLLSFSKHPEIAKAFMDFAASKEGGEIMKKYGFMD